MNKTKISAIILLSFLFVMLSFYLFNPPQCPDTYTQQQIDSSRCIVGANIGGPILFIGSIPLILIISIFLNLKILKTKK